MEVLFSTYLPEVVFILCGLVSIDCAFRALKNEESRIPTFIFWFSLGIIFIAGKYVPAYIVGALLVVMGILTATKQVKIGTFKEVSKEEKEASAQKIGNKIFIPAILIGVIAFLLSFIKIGGKSLSGAVVIGIGCLVSLITAIIITKPKLNETREDTAKLLMQVGASALLPQLLGALGKVFSEAQVGTLIASIVSGVVPSNSVLFGVVAYCLGMVIFTMIMGNAFAAFSVITAGIGIPFVIAQGGNPAVVAALGMTCGYCGTLLSPMAANFNVVPAAILETKSKWRVIIAQAPMALIMIIIHIVLMLTLAF